MMLSKIIVIADGGLANRIRPLFSALALAELLGLNDSDVSVYWRPTVACDGSITDVVSAPVNELDLDFIDSLHDRSAFLYREGSVRNALTLFKGPDIPALLEKCTSKSFESSHNLEEFIREVSNNFHTLVLFDNQPLNLSVTHSNLYSLKIKSLSFVPEIERAAEQFMADNKLDGASLGVHARGTDFRVPFVYYSKQIRQHGLSEPWFFASDSLSFNEYVSNNFKNVALRQKQLPVYNSGILGLFESISRPITSVKDAAIDLRILASVNLKIYHPHSTFALLALELGCR